MDKLTDEIIKLNKQVGKLSGQVDIILNKLDSMSSKYNGYIEKTTRIEERLEDVSNMLLNHINDHRTIKGWKLQTKAAIAGGIAGSVTGFILSMLLLIFGKI